MANTAIIRDAYGVPAVFVGSKTGRDDAPFVFVSVGGEERRMRCDDAPFVFVSVGGEERRMRCSEWDALPIWTGERPSWVNKGGS
jgi:hypothetical protein